MNYPKKIPTLEVHSFAGAVDWMAAHIPDKNHAAILATCVDEGWELLLRRHFNGPSVALLPGIPAEAINDRLRLVMKFGVLGHVISSGWTTGDATQDGLRSVCVMAAAWHARKMKIAAEFGEFIDGVLSVMRNGGDGAFFRQAIDRRVEVIMHKRLRSTFCVAHSDYVNYLCVELGELALRWKNARRLLAFIRDWERPEFRASVALEEIL